MHLCWIVSFRLIDSAVLSETVKNNLKQIVKSIGFNPKNDLSVSPCTFSLGKQTAVNTRLFDIEPIRIDGGSTFSTETTCFNRIPSNKISHINKRHKFSHHSFHRMHNKHTTNEQQSKLKNMWPGPVPGSVLNIDESAINITSTTTTTPGQDI